MKKMCESRFSLDKTKQNKSLPSHYDVAKLDWNWCLDVEAFIGSFRPAGNGSDLPTP